MFVMPNSFASAARFIHRDVGHDDLLLLLESRGHWAGVFGVERNLARLGAEGVVVSTSGLQAPFALVGDVVGRNLEAVALLGPEHRVGGSDVLEALPKRGRGDRRDLRDVRPVGSVRAIGRAELEHTSLEPNEAD